MPGFKGWEERSEVITTNQRWVVPRAKDNKFEVRIFGGGGGARKGNIRAKDSYTPYEGYDWRQDRSGNGYIIYSTSATSNDSLYMINAYSGGGGGYMCSATFTNLRYNDGIDIFIGPGGAVDSNGGTTSFGPYLSAKGGETGRIEASKPVVSDHHYYQTLAGGNGGTGGGAVSTWNSTANGGSGQYGGGGGGFIGGKGGTYGGAGGSWNTKASDGTEGGAGGDSYFRDIVVGLIDDGRDDDKFLVPETIYGEEIDDYSAYYTFNSSYFINRGLGGGGGEHGGNGGDGLKCLSTGLNDLYLRGSFERQQNNLVWHVFARCQDNAGADGLFLGGGGGGWKGTAPSASFDSGDVNLSSGIFKYSGTVAAGGGGGWDSYACGGTGGPGTNGVCIINYTAAKF